GQHLSPMKSEPTSPFGRGSIFGRSPQSNSEPTSPFPSPGVGYPRAGYGGATSPARPIHPPPGYGGSPEAKSQSERDYQRSPAQPIHPPKAGHAAPGAGPSQNDILLGGSGSNDLTGPNSWISKTLRGSSTTLDPKSAPALVPARVYLRAADIPPPSVGAYGVVALRSKATPANRERLLRTCMAYRASLPPQKTLPSSIPPSNQMLTIWPLDEPDSTDASKD